MENLMLGLKVALIGIVVVFAILALLMIVFMIIERALRKKTKGQSPTKEQKPSNKVKSNEAENQDDIVAAITASIMMIYQSENGGMVPSFQIRKIKEIKRR